MKFFCRLGQRLPQRPPRRWWLAACSGALVGVFAGHELRPPVSLVDGASMAPTFQPGAFVFTVPITSTLQRGDIVMLDDGKSDYAIKRIVGMPGETVHLWRGYVFINHRMLREPYLAKLTYTCPYERSGAIRFQLATDQYFVLGDNRTCSLDSRAYGPVQRHQIKSRVPLPDNALRANFAPYGLPALGKHSIRPLDQNRVSLRFDTPARPSADTPSHS